MEWTEFEKKYPVKEPDPKLQCANCGGRGYFRSAIFDVCGCFHYDGTGNWQGELG